MGISGSHGSGYDGELVAAVAWLLLWTASTNTSSGTRCEGWVEEEGEGSEEIVCSAAGDEGALISVEGRSTVGGFSSGCAWDVEGGSSNTSNTSGGPGEAAGTLRRPSFSAASTNPAGTTMLSSLSSTSVASPSSSPAAACFLLVPKLSEVGTTTRGTLKLTGLAP